MNIDEGFSTLPLMMWGHRVKPINRRISIRMIGKQLFVLKVLVSESKSETIWL